MTTIWLAITGLTTLLLLCIFAQRAGKKCPTCDTRQDKKGDCRNGCRHRDDINY